MRVPDRELLPEFVPTLYDTVPFPLPLLRFWCLRILPGWCLIAVMIFLVQIAVCGIVHDSEKVKAMLSFLEMLPSAMKTALGGEALQAGKPLSWEISNAKNGLKSCPRRSSSLRGTQGEI